MSARFEEPESKHLFFSSNCLRSPLSNPSYPDVVQTGTIALYNPIIDAMFLPSQNELQLPVGDYTNLAQTSWLLEAGHRLLAATTIMCQIRLVGAIMHRCILLVMATHGSDGPTLREADFYAIVDPFRTTLDHFLCSAQSLHEAFALYYAIDTLKNKYPTATGKYKDPEDLASKCLAQLDSETRRVYDSLMDIDRRFGHSRLTCQIVKSALNVPWLPLLTQINDPHIFDDPDHLNLTVQQYFDDPINSPLTRLDRLLELVDEIPLVGLSNMPDHELHMALSKTCPRFFEALRHPCRTKCICKLLRRPFSQGGRASETLDPVDAALYLSLKIDEQIHSQRHAEESAIVGSMAPATWSAIWTQETLVPHLLFQGNKCVIKGTPGTASAFLLASYESIRQQLDLPEDLRRQLGLPLSIPWSGMDIRVGRKDGPVFKDYSCEMFDLFWEATRDFPDAKTWNNPHQ